MSQNTLIKKIKNDAAKVVEEIKTQGASQIEVIQSEIETKIIELRKSHAVALEKTKNQMELVSISRARQAGNIAIQSAKREQIDSIFSTVVADLENQDSESYVTFFTKHINEILPKKVEITKTLAPVKRKDETEKLLKAIDSSASIITDLAIKAGLIIHTKDGVYDITLDRLIKEQKNELEMLVVKKVIS